MRMCCVRYLYVGALVRLPAAQCHSAGILLENFRHFSLVPHPCTYTHQHCPNCPGSWLGLDSLDLEHTYLESGTLWQAMATQVHLWPYTPIHSPPTVLTSSLLSLSFQPPPLTPHPLRCCLLPAVSSASQRAGTATWCCAQPWAPMCCAPRCRPHVGAVLTA